MASVTVESDDTDSKKSGRYARIISRVFASNYKVGLTTVPFERNELESAAQAEGVDAAKNLGDIVYSYRFRKPMPSSILATQPAGLEWRIKLSGIGKYSFVLGPPALVLPDSALTPIPIPDATPQIIARYALNDEQAILAIIRYNRLLDIFLGLTTYSLQNHLRTTVEGMGQVEVDELYVGLDDTGKRFAIPVQAKGGKDKISIAQTEQDILMCQQKFEGMEPLPVSVQILADGTLCMFLLNISEQDTLEVKRERHYKLVSEPKRSTLSARSKKALPDKEAS